MGTTLHFVLIIFVLGLDSLRLIYSHKSILNWLPSNSSSSISKIQYHENGKEKRRYLRSKKLEPKLQVQKCREGGEAYSASYLISKEHLLYQFTDYNLSWVNCEMASFIMMRRFGPINGSITQSVDILDLSVIHLSPYERLQKR